LLREDRWSTLRAMTTTERKPNQARFTGPHSQAARQFPHAQVIDVPNAWHGPEREATGCALPITPDFIRNQRLGDTSCLAKIPSLPVK
jgi:hypothetical protein